MAYTLDQLVGFAQQAGFSGQSAQTIAAIAMAESGGNPYAINPNDPGGSYGLTQINQGAHGPTAQNTLGDPLEAFRQAFSISGGGSNFSPWSTYTNGMYLPFAAQLGIAGGGGSGGLDPQGNPLGAIGGGSGSGDPNAGLTGTTATGQPTTAKSPLSAIFGAVANLFQSFGLLILGAILLAIGAWYTAKPSS